MSREAYAYVAGGAGLESTIDANRAAFDRRRIVPRMMRDVSERDLSVELLGRRLPTPFLLAPIGASSNGAGSSAPSNVVERSRSETSRSMRGTIRRRWKASRLARIVSSVPAPAKT